MFSFKQEVFSLVFGNVERIYTELISGCNAANKYLVAMIELDGMKL